MYKDHRGPSRPNSGRALLKNKYYGESPTYPPSDKFIIIIIGFYTTISELNSQCPQKRKGPHYFILNQVLAK
jgi:hypothetical protein